MDGAEDGSRISPGAWAAVTLVLIVVSLTLDPLWAYYAAWTTGFMTMFSAIRREISQRKRREIAAEDEALLLEVRDSKTLEETKDGATD